jgi:hypothetical protein
MSRSTATSDKATATEPTETAPETPAGKPAEEATAETATRETGETPASTDTEEAEKVDWRQHARTWESRARENAREARTAEKQAADATQRAEAAQARSAALELVIDHGLSRSDVDLLLEAGSDESRRNLAKRLANTGTGPYVPDQGTQVNEPKPDKEREFVRHLFKK